MYLTKESEDKSLIRIGVCDDSPEFLQLAVDMVEKWSSQSGTMVEVHRFDNGDALLDQNAVTHMDIVFLDIIMPLQNGIDTAKELRQSDTAVKIIFLTSSAEFALDSYEVKASGYLLKPVSFEKVKELLDECSISFAKEPENITLKTTFGYQKIYFHDIEYAEAQNKKVVLYLRNGKTVEVLETMRFLEERLGKNASFFKCHRSYLVYMPSVANFNMMEIVTMSKRRVPIARGYGKAFKEAYFSFTFKD